MVQLRSVIRLGMLSNPRLRQPARATFQQHFCSHFQTWPSNAPKLAIGSTISSIFIYMHICLSKFEENLSLNRWGYVINRLINPTTIVGGSLVFLTWGSGWTWVWAMKYPYNWFEASNAQFNRTSQQNRLHLSQYSWPPPGLADWHLNWLQVIELLSIR